MSSHKNSIRELLQSQLFVRFTQGGLFKCLARLQAATRWRPKCFAGLERVAKEQDSPLLVNHDQARGLALHRMNRHHFLPSRRILEVKARPWQALKVGVG